MKCVYLFILAVLFSFVIAPDPFNRTEKKLPSGNWENIIPKTVADYKQIAFQPPTREEDGAAYYRKGNQIIYISFNLLKDRKQLQEWMNVAAGDELKTGAEINTASLDGENKFVLVGKKEKYFFAWNRGNFYFDVLCEHGKDEMEGFMKDFPY